MLYLDVSSRERKLFKSTNKVCYLLLDIGVPTDGTKIILLGSREERYSLKDQILIAKKACKKMGVRLRVLEVRTEEYKHLRYVFHTPYFRKDDKKVTKAIESFVFSLSLFTLTHISDNFKTHYCFPSFLVHDDLYLLGPELVNFEETRPYKDKLLSSPTSDLLSFGVSGSHHDYMEAWKFSSVVFSKDHLFNAARFLVNSQKHFSGEINELIENPDEQADNSLEQNILEDALISAFKAIEAILGDLPKKDTKLQNKILEIGLDPFEMVGYVDKQPLYLHIREMENFRNQKSAHGRGLNRDITYLELEGFQECARTVVYHGIRSELEKQSNKDKDKDKSRE